MIKSHINIKDYKLIVGLGNIGTQYDHTRHNLGFIFLDILKKQFLLSEFAANKKSNFIISKNQNFNMIKPITYMNSSGLAVLSYLSKNRCKPSEILVIHDDLNLANHTIKFKEGGGTGGHNGLKSISAAIGQDYHRVRLGISHPGENVAHYVLEKTDLSAWNDLIVTWINENQCQS
ncbi:aminoacyl-tRNA hydrolase [Candidatus Cytomitobacter primus]|uniref:Peptidyl-tRNA hydrolase n=1 Tax=Candidatus Cytomitobacter primus TaxID=2066024 RepID=A0A5C0UE86_9PROT|nr:aminoacyl-tRNA hydrolase [Candidatus Cytomitobacter primus]QEK38348.1 aminoacyl-tRNA hydrolase [Candidatus Cytomitobacter primus]